ncbi:alpha-L-rhamnosidase C-terminal domain-containing protein [Streptomyces canus]|uniref:alpha-L-rhamnosidase-related protein n=1 Tax=Streptomyces canus TaxID=58343 RepID=UPI0036E3F8D2
MQWDVRTRLLNSSYWAPAAVVSRPGAGSWRARDRECIGWTGDYQVFAPSAVRLTFGLVPEKLRDAAVERLVALIRAAGRHLGTGFLSTADLLPLLADTGHADLAYEVLLQRAAPSWLAMLDRGATTMWEDWEGIDENGDAHDSLNHYSKGAVINFPHTHTHTLGLRQAEGSAAWERFVVAPVPHVPVERARGTFDSPRGTIEVEWRTEGDELHITVDVPPTSTVIFPEGEELAAGPGQFTVRRSVGER